MFSKQTIKNIEMKNQLVEFMTLNGIDVRNNPNSLKAIISCDHRNNNFEKVMSFFSFEESFIDIDVEEITKDSPVTYMGLFTHVITIETIKE